METEFNDTQRCLNPLKLFVSMAAQTAIPYADLLEVTEKYFITTQINLWFSCKLQIFECAPGYTGYNNGLLNRNMWSCHLTTF